MSIDRSADMKTRIKEARKRAGLSQAEAASLFHISLSTYRNWETGRAMMNGAQLLEVADAFETTVDYLLMVDVKAYDDDERELLSMYEDMNRKDRKVVLTLCRALLGQYE